MAKRFIAPSLADLRQDIAGPIPVAVIQAWMQSSRDDDAERDILSAYRKRGTVVSSDSVGLSRLTRERPLVEVMKLISEPKEIIHAYGTAIGGKAVGIWIADNTEMHYREEISPRAVVEQMIGAQREIARLPVQVGIAIHCGEFLEIGGGVFGPEADFVEELAETYTVGGEIIVTPAVKERLDPGIAGMQLAGKTLADRETYGCDYSTASSEVVCGSNRDYPCPFNKDFFDFLRKYDGQDSGETRRVLSTYARDTIVVLLKIHHPPTPLILNQLTQWVIANAVVQDVAAQDSVITIKTNGSLGIFLVATPEQAREFAEDLRSALVANGYDYNIGIAGGEVLVFPMGEKGQFHEIAGEPVNIASKISEDIGERNAIYVDSSVSRAMKPVAAAEPFQLRISRIELTGIKLPATSNPVP